MKLLNRLRRIMADERGYTLVELAVAMLIFLIASVVVLGALVTVIQSSTKTTADRRSQQDARYSIEEIARQARSATIDYQFYVKNAGDARCAFSPAGSNSTKALALVITEADSASGPSSKRMVFFQDNNAVWRYQNNVATLSPTCDEVFTAPVDQASGPSKSKITASSGTATDVMVPLLTFYVSPNQNPYDKATPCGAACQLARNTHPRTTILMTVQITGAGAGVSRQSKSGITTLQTTVGSRAYPVTTLLGQPAV